jgi:organic hydroperoxide reductase OsmC/OhrA
MDAAHFYEVSVNWTSERKGKMSSPELGTTIEVATPPQFSNGMAGIWSPEHLFVAAVNSCLMTTFLSIAENSQLDFDRFSSKAIGKLEQKDGKYIISEVTLMPVLTLSNAGQLSRAEKVLQKSETHCLISNSIRSKVIFKPEVKLKSGVQL